MKQKHGSLQGVVKTITNAPSLVRLKLALQGVHNGLTPPQSALSVALGVPKCLGGGVEGLLLSDPGTRGSREFLPNRGSRDLDGSLDRAVGANHSAQNPRSTEGLPVPLGLFRHGQSHKAFSRRRSDSSSSGSPKDSEGH